MANEKLHEAALIWGKERGIGDITPEMLDKLYTNALIDAFQYGDADAMIDLVGSETKAADILRHSVGNKQFKEKLRKLNAEKSGNKEEKDI